MALLAHETVFEAIDLYAISWGTPRRPAYNLGETTKRKSQAVGRLLKITGMVRSYRL